MIEMYVLLGTLGVHSIEDVKRKEITISVTLFSAILGILLHLFYQDESIYSMLAGMFSGILIVFLSIISKGKIGMGDGVVFMLTGLYLGLWKNLLLMLLSFCLAAIWALCVIICKPKHRQEKMPFMPFLFIGYIVLFLCGGICV